MKLTIEQVESRLTAAWGKQAFVVPYRLAGNRYSYLVTDHTEHWLPLFTGWAGGHQVFEPVGGVWPEQKGDPWLDAVCAAAQLAQAYFEDRENRAALRRLPRALGIAEGRRWTPLGDGEDTWLIPSQSGSGIYHVNGRCTCPDYLENGVPGGWCKHRLARALAKRAAEILKEEATTEGVPQKPDTTTAPTNGQAQRIDLIVGYQADEAKALSRVNGNGKLISFKADGQEAAVPSPALPELYRWLQSQGYAPRDFKWLGWEHGLRQRQQTYTREVAQ